MADNDPTAQWRHYQVRALAAWMSALVFISIGWWAIERQFYAASLFALICFAAAILYGLINWVRCALARRDCVEAKRQISG